MAIDRSQPLTPRQLNLEARGARVDPGRLTLRAREKEDKP
jgi:hypothetical protein